MDSILKKCSKCKQKQVKTMFYKNKSRYDGLDNICKDCRKSIPKNIDKSEVAMAKRRKSAKKYYENNKEKIAQRQIEYKKNNRDIILNIKKRYYKNKKNNDNMFLLVNQIRNLISSAIKRKGYKKNTKTEIIIGCDYKTLEKHLVSTFENRYGISIQKAEEKLHIDHIIPISSAKTEEEVVKLNHYTNLQYLYASDNLKKSNKIVGDICLK